MCILPRELVIFIIDNNSLFLLNKEYTREYFITKILCKRNHTDLPIFEIHHTNTTHSSPRFLYIP